jgi:RNA polymerase sigma factor (sigma-70 family)
MTDTTLQERIESITPRLRKYAAIHATPSVSADDLFQIAAEEILNHCSPTDNDTYMLRLADWRMKNAVKRERTYTVRVEEIESDDDDDEDDDNHGGLKIRDITGTPEELAAYHEIERRIRDLIPTLKPEHVNLIELLSEGYSQHEIARLLNTSQTRVRYHILKIRAAFEQAGLSPSLAFA